MQKLILLLLLVSLCTSAHAQNNRLSTYERIGWYNYFGSFMLHNKISIHTEYQYRRENIITHWQQGLLRLGVNYHFNSDVLIRMGYAWIETFPYGELPVNGLGKDFTEHRIFQMIQLLQRAGTVNISHRYMLEQRFVGRYSSPFLHQEDEFPLLHRMRYMIRLQIPISGSGIDDRSTYIACFNEIFIGFGNNVNANIFDQNRIGIMAGYRFNSKLRLEAGYLNQIIQFGRQLNGLNIFQYNNGIIINTNVNIDLRQSQ